jgi:hypothetical protein
VPPLVEGLMRALGPRRACPPAHEDVIRTATRMEKQCPK